jgi:hypothetical protein
MLSELIIHKRKQYLSNLLALMLIGISIITIINIINAKILHFLIIRIENIIRYQCQRRDNQL